MAYSVKERQEEIGMIKKNNRGEYIRVARIIPENLNRLESLDIRLMYTADDGSVRPTTRGVRLNSEILPEVVRLIIKGLSTEEMEELEVMLSEDGIRIIQDDEVDVYEEDDALDDGGEL